MWFLGPGDLPGSQPPQVCKIQRSIYSTIPVYHYFVGLFFHSGIPNPTYPRYPSPGGWSLRSFKGVWSTNAHRHGECLWWSGYAWDRLRRHWSKTYHGTRSYRYMLLLELWAKERMIFLINIYIYVCVCKYRLDMIGPKICKGISFVDIKGFNEKVRNNWSVDWLIQIDSTWLDSIWLTDAASTISSGFWHPSTLLLTFLFHSFALRNAHGSCHWTEAKILGFFFAGRDRRGNSCISFPPSWELSRLNLRYVESKNAKEMAGVWHRQFLNVSLAKC